MCPRLLPLAAIAAMVALLPLAACSRPSPPTLVVKTVKVTQVTTTGLDVTVTADVTNPNDVALTARRVSANVVVEKRFPLGPVAVDRSVTLPAHATTTVEAPASARWQDLGALTALVGQQGPVHFDVEGTVNVGGDRLNVDLPFRASGEITRAQLLQATLNGLPKLP